MKKKPTLLWVLAVACLTPLLVLRISLLRMPRPPFDFDTYWAAGRLFLARLPPYSPSRMMHLEQSVGWKSHIIQLMLCPPWTLPIFALDGSLPFHLAHSLWLAVSIVLDLLSSLGLWLYFGGSRRDAWIALVIAATFLPMGGAEYMGQITPLVLFCLTAFLLLTQKQRYFLAGLCLFGLGIKPHLTYLVFLAVLVWIIRERRWSTLAGALTISSAFMLGAAMYNPHSLNYFHSGFHVAIGKLNAIGGILRSIFGAQRRWLQFLPSVFGAGWLLWYLRQHRSDWDWRRHFPLLILVSVSTAAYGWYHDFVLVLPALIVLGVRRAYTSPSVLILYLAIQMIVLYLGSVSKAWMFAACSLWIAFFLFADRSTPDRNTAPRQADQTQTA